MEYEVIKMNNTEKGNLAVELKHSGYNCCQAVLCAFKDECGLDEALLKQIGAAYCAGMGCMESTCGALCAAEILLGLQKYEGHPILRDAAELHHSFVFRCGASLCKDLKGRDTGRVLCECDDCVRTGAELAAERLF